MGDTGSLTIEGLLYLSTGKKRNVDSASLWDFLVETFRWCYKVSYFKYTKNDLVEGRRTFLMSPCITIKKKG